MNREQNCVASLQWPLILGLAAIALLRPLVNILVDRAGLTSPAAVPIGLTVVISAVWITVVGLGRVTRPVLTLVATGTAYGVLAILLSGALSPILTGQLQGPLATPIAIVPMLLINAAWGAICGALAVVLQRLAARRTTAPRRP